MSTEPPRGSAPQLQQRQMGSTGLAPSSKWSSWTGGEHLHLSSLEICAPLFPHCPSGLLPSAVHRIGSLRIYVSSLSECNIHIAVPTADVFQPAGVPAVGVQYPNLPTWEALLSERCCKMFQTARRGFWKTFLKLLPEDKGVFFQNTGSFLLFNCKSDIDASASSAVLQRFLSCYLNSVAISVWHFYSS